MTTRQSRVLRPLLAEQRQVEGLKLEKLFEKGDEAFVRYQVTRVDDGVKFRNAEYLKCAGNRIAEIQVYFGAEEKK